MQGDTESAVPRNVPEIHENHGHSSSFMVITANFAYFVLSFYR
jgi:hypothetical protein